MVVSWDSMMFHIYLVDGDWNMTGLLFHSVGNFIIPTDELIFFRWEADITMEKNMKKHHFRWVNQL